MAAFYALMVALFIHREMRVPEIYGVLLRAAKTTSIVMFLCAGAQVASYMITLADLPNVLTAWLGPLVESPRLMAVMMIVLVMIGTALDLTPTILIFAPVMLPIAVKAGIDPVYFGLMFVLNGAIGLITRRWAPCSTWWPGWGASRCTASSRGEPVPADLRADPGAAGGLSADRDRAGAFGCVDDAARSFPCAFFPLANGDNHENFPSHSCWPPCRWLLCCLVPGRCPRLQTAHHPLRLRAQRGFQPGPRHRCLPKRWKKPRAADACAPSAAALGSDLQMQQALIGGAQEMMVGSTATLVGITKEMAIWDTPFLFNNAKEADVVLDGPVGRR